MGTNAQRNDGTRYKKSPVKRGAASALGMHAKFPQIANTVAQIDRSTRHFAPRIVVGEINVRKVS
ncbi:MAG: hypothetical protein ABJF10_13935, partial [Chthoniobacter sp.]|uniref:hypothetical protein n=1 Tax=Chthoniobacter sp. TaxID=2510640 RepID=UPI0032A27435